MDDLLKAYNLHHSGQETHTETKTKTEASKTTTMGSLPWVTDWRRVPPYHEVYRHARAQRPCGQNATEIVVGEIVFVGVWTNAVRTVEFLQSVRNRLTQCTDDSMDLA